MPRTAILNTWIAPEPCSTVIVFVPTSIPVTGMLQDHIGEENEPGSTTGSGRRIATSISPAGM